MLLLCATDCCGLKCDHGHGNNLLTDRFYAAISSAEKSIVLKAQLLGTVFESWNCESGKCKTNRVP